jgi:hypothetical protein
VKGPFGKASTEITQKKKITHTMPAQMLFFTSVSSLKKMRMKLSKSSPLEIVILSKMLRQQVSEHWQTCLVHSICGSVVEWIVAIDSTRVRFPANAHLFFASSHNFFFDE